MEFWIAVLLFFFFFSGASFFVVPFCLLPLPPYTFVEWNIGSHHLSGYYGAWSHLSGIWVSTTTTTYYLAAACIVTLHIVTQAVSWCDLIFFFGSLDFYYHHYISANLVLPRGCLHIHIAHCHVSIFLV